MHLSMYWNWKWGKESGQGWWKDCSTIEAGIVRHIQVPKAGEFKKQSSSMRTVQPGDRDWTSLQGRSKEPAGHPRKLDALGENKPFKVRTLFQWQLVLEVPWMYMRQRRINGERNRCSGQWHLQFNLSQYPVHTMPVQFTYSGNLNSVSNQHDRNHTIGNQ